MSRTLTVAGGCAAECSVGTSYDDAGKVLTQTYPTNEVVANTYDNAGWLNQMGTTQGNTTLLNTVSYSPSDYGGPAGLMTSATFGSSGINASWSHDALLRLTGSQLWQCGGGRCVPNPTFSESRNFDAAGNVSAVSAELGDIHSIDTQGFCYDEQDRLVWAGSTGTPPTGCTLSVTPSSFGSAGYQRSYGYDTLGRLTTGALGTYSYGDPTHHLHAATAIGSTWTAAYDPAGNMTCRSPSNATTCAGTPTGAQLGYAADGSLSTWQNAPASPTTTTSFLYDGNGTRVAQQVTQNGTATTNIYVGNLEQLITSGSTTTTQTYYYANGLRFAMAVNGGFSYLAGDALGSIESATGSSQSYALFDPYGQVRYSSGTMPTDYGFTGQHADTVIGLDYYSARYYDPLAGQFISADSILPGSGYDLWGLSRYAYVEGNPIVRTDPSGNTTLCLAAAVAGTSGCGGTTDPPSGAGPGTGPPRDIGGDSHPTSSGSGSTSPISPSPPDSQPWNPCLYGMGVGCNPQQAERAGAYTGDIFHAEHQLCRADPACRQASDDMAFIGMMFIPGPDAIVAVFLIERGGVVLRLLFRVLGRTGTKAAEEDLSKAAFKYATEPNKLTHIFREEHGLDTLVQQFGSRESVVREVLTSITGRTPVSGYFEVTTQVGGQTLKVSGVVQNGITKIGTFFPLP
jgi:RHS repeat-associated protein